MTEIEFTDEDMIGNLCRSCSNGRCVVRGLCIVCRTPKDRRELVKYGIPRGTVDVVTLIARKAGKDAANILKCVHPRVMANVGVDGNGALFVLNRSLRWVRRAGWVESRE